MAMEMDRLTASVRLLQEQVDLLLVDRIPSFRQPCAGSIHDDMNPTPSWSCRLQRCNCVCATGHRMHSQSPSQHRAPATARMPPPIRQAIHGHLSSRHVHTRNICS